jgi:hypothetical protein
MDVVVTLENYSKFLKEAAVEFMVEFKKIYSTKAMQKY